MKIKKENLLPKQQQKLNQIAAIVREHKSITIYRLSLLMEINWKTLEIGYLPLLPEVFEDIQYDKDTKTLSCVVIPEGTELSEKHKQLIADKQRVKGVEHDKSTQTKIRK